MEEIVYQHLNNTKMKYKQKRIDNLQSLYIR